MKYSADSAVARPASMSNLWLAFAFIPLGLLADLFDGKVARWRGKSSLMGQELDSLADLVGASQGRCCFHSRLIGCPGHIWCCTGSNRILRRLSHRCGPITAHLLCAMRSHASGTVQCHGADAAQGQDWQEQVLRRRAGTFRLLHIVHIPGVLVIHRSDRQGHSVWHELDRINIGVPSYGAHLRGLRDTDGQQDSQGAQALATTVAQVGTQKSISKGTAQCESIEVYRFAAGH
jgi:hypothetical protein